MAPAESRARPREREVGSVLSITPSGLITVRASSAQVPPEGTPLCDRSGRAVGSILRVFGPVARPYLSVRPRGPLRAGEAASLIGGVLRTA